MVLTREQKIAAAAFAGGVLVGFLVSRVRVSGSLTGLSFQQNAQAAVLGMLRGRHLNAIDVPGAALRGIVHELEGTPT